MIGERDRIDRMIERPGPLGAVAVDRPLLLAGLFALGCAAAAAVGAARGAGASAPTGVVADFLVQALFALALPLALAAAAPARHARRVAFGVASAAALSGVVFAAARFAPVDFGVIGISPASALVAAGLALALMLMRPFCGATTGLAAPAPLAGALAAAGAAGGLALFGASGEALYGPAVTLNLALGCVIGVAAAAAFAEIFSAGADASVAAGGAAQRTAPTALHAAACTLAAFALTRTPDGALALNGVATATACVALAGLAAVFLSAGALALRRTSDAVAVEENYRRRRARDAWRPFRSVLPASTSIAATAIMLILTVVAALEAATPGAGAKLIAAVGCGVAAGACYLSLRTGALVAIVSVSAVGLVDWTAALFGVAPPEGAASATAIVAAATLFGLLGLTWRDARSPRRKPHQSAELAMVEGAYRFIVGAAFVVGAFAAAATSGLWPEAAGAAGYFLAVAGLGFVLSPAVMTAVTAVAGRG